MSSSDQSLMLLAEVMLVERRRSPVGSDCWRFGQGDLSRCSTAAPVRPLFHLGRRGLPHHQHRHLALGHDLAVTEPSTRRLRCPGHASPSSAGRTLPFGRPGMTSAATPALATNSALISASAKNARDRLGRPGRLFGVMRFQHRPVQHRGGTSGTAACHAAARILGRPAICHAARWGQHALGERAAIDRDEDLHGAGSMRMGSGFGLASVASQVRPLVRGQRQRAAPAAGRARWV